MYNFQTKGLKDAPIDGKQYARENGDWTEVTGGGGGGSSVIVDHVTTYALLPVANIHGGEYWLVDTTTGTWILGTQKIAGIYKSNGSTWVYIDSTPETTSLSDGTTIITGTNIILEGSSGISTTAIPASNKVTISGSGLLPTVFNTTLDFLSGEQLVNATIADATMNSTKTIKCYYSNKAEEVIILGLQVSELSRTDGVGFVIQGFAPVGAIGVYNVRCEVFN